MVSARPSPTSPEDIDITITFSCSIQEPIYVSIDTNGWIPQQMELEGQDAYRHVTTVPRRTQAIRYKFRIGDSDWFHDPAVSAEPDNFFGYNNTYTIPEVPRLPPKDSHPPNDFDDDTELESVAAVESIADTLSEVDVEDARLNGEPELIHVDDVISDPEYSGTKHHFLPKEQKTRHEEVVAVEKPGLPNILLRLSCVGVIAAGLAWYWLAE
ncbi:hypothetical protein EJ08DRAFT_664578 [Tothia fuscella]|uniref:AMP-activated protein kinase glycogen-binding domain-containing protein n=1 Tax=Tothia fuscella TaxID=1048955 RepID=A0A9P4NJ13_9PEZI|nr:hypothetical protein EJ08DRAFT_664578 [Tothia fuscella]